MVSVRNNVIQRKRGSIWNHKKFFWNHIIITNKIFGITFYYILENVIPSKNVESQKIFFGITFYICFGITKLYTIICDSKYQDNGNLWFYFILWLIVILFYIYKLLWFQSIYKMWFQKKFLWFQMEPRFLWNHVLPNTYQNQITHHYLLIAWTNHLYL